MVPRTTGQVMRILVHEFATGGGLAGTDVPASLAREGRAMRDALSGDLARTGEHRVVVSVDPRFPFVFPHFPLLPPDVSNETPVVILEVMPNPAPYGPWIDRIIDGVDAVWLVAPETGGCLEDVSRRVERIGKRLLGSPPEAIRAAADKASLGPRLEASGVRYPPTVVLPANANRSRLREAITGLSFPLVVKPRRGAGSEDVCWFADRETMGRWSESGERKDMIVQEYVEGTPASVSLLVSDGRADVLAVNAQEIDFRPGSEPAFRYRGGVTPFDHPGAREAAEVATRACQSVPGLRGYVGVDLVLAARGAVVIEVNPRLTSAYLGLRHSIGPQLAGLGVEACSGVLRRQVHANRSIRFTETGEITSSIPVPEYVHGAVG